MGLKKIEAIIRVEKLEEIKNALEEKGFIGMTLTDVKGRGNQKGILLEWRAGEYRVEFLPKLKIELVVDESSVETVVSIISDTARTGRAGDGKIFTSPVDEVVRVRTGEKGRSVL
ncbi:P-II family nitrogen regulator [Candidatus Saganbacteria bacterium]|nr:P-II family nitrogen regulator [Candidatus Saganbacteria bacterium]